MDKIKQKNKITSISFAMLIIYVFIGFVFSHTVFENPIVSTIFYLTLFIFFIISIFFSRTSFGDVSSICIIWTPFLFLTIIEYSIIGSFPVAAKWLICFLMLLLAHFAPIDAVSKDKLTLAFGFFFLIGIFFHFLFTDFYNQNVAVLFKNQSQIINWSRGYGFAGFTYQLGTSAELLIIAETIVIFSPNVFKNKLILRRLLIVLLVVSIFLTGKRFISLLSILVPVTVSILSIRNTTKRIISCVVFIVLFVVAYFILKSIAVYIPDTDYGLGRIIKSTISFSDGGDITSGRTQLYSLAVNLWETSPIFGIGVSRFEEVAGVQTDVHNAYLQTLCEQGIIGFILFIIPIIFVLAKTILTIYKSYNLTQLRYLQMSLMLQLIFVLDAFTENKNINPSGFMIYFLSVAILICVRTNEMKYNSNWSRQNENSVL